MLYGIFVMFGMVGFQLGLNPILPFLTILLWHRQLHFTAMALPHLIIISPTPQQDCHVLHFTLLDPIQAGYLIY